MQRYDTMRKIARKFEEIWAKAEERNGQYGQRYFKCYNQYKRYVSMGIYDSETKKYVLFDTINLAGNFRYNSKEVPAEFNEMEKLID